jgi:peptidoglycan/LPS O-acetylase OafA/YrhL
MFRSYRPASFFNKFLDTNGHVFGAFTAQFWSLAVEEHFYLLCPLGLVLLGRNIRKIRLAVMAAILVVVVWKIIDIQ